MNLTYERVINGRYETGKVNFTKTQFKKLTSEGDKMSVPAYKRETSTMEYISKAKELLSFTISMCSKIPKKYTFYGVVDTYNVAQTIVDTLIRANNLNVKKYYVKRTELLDDALGWLAVLSDHLTLLKTYVQLTEKQWVKWGVLISITETLIKGVKASDSKRLGARL